MFDETRLMVDAGLEAASPDLAVVTPEGSSLDGACWPAVGPFEEEDDEDVHIEVDAG